MRTLLICLVTVPLFCALFAESCEAHRGQSNAIGAMIVSSGAGLGGAVVGLLLGILFGVLWSEAESDQRDKSNPHSSRPGTAGSLAVALLLFASMIGLGVAVITKKALLIGAAAAVFLVSLLGLWFYLKRSEQESA
jgi:hypothetical protein